VLKKRANDVASSNTKNAGMKLPIIFAFWTPNKDVAITTISLPDDTFLKDFGISSRDKYRSQYITCE
ncbi:MAG: hypothetical protein ACI8RD_004951, partial [Bacillariaceae sp.]|jgi:hypothetical protein